MGGVFTHRMGTFNNAPFGEVSVSALDGGTILRRNIAKQHVSAIDGGTILRRNIAKQHVSAIDVAVILKPTP